MQYSNGGHRTPSTQQDTVDYQQIMTTGNAIDFGDLTIDIKLQVVQMVMVVLVELPSQETAEYLLPFFASVTP